MLFVQNYVKQVREREASAKKGDYWTYYNKWQHYKTNETPGIYIYKQILAVTKLLHTLQSFRMATAKSSIAR